VVFIACVLTFNGNLRTTLMWHALPTQIYVEMITLWGAFLFEAVQVGVVQNVSMQ